MNNTDTSLNFESARMKGVLNVLNKNQAEIVKLVKKNRMLESELNILKIKYLELQEDYVKKVYGVWGYDWNNNNCYYFFFIIFNI